MLHHGLTPLPESRTVVLGGSIKQPRAWLIVERQDFTETLEAAPLYQRGWVMQERLLAPRVVHFLHGELIWECSQVIVSEKSPYDKVTDQLPPAVPR